MVEIGTTACKWDSVIPFNRYIVIKEGRRDKILYKDEFMTKLPKIYSDTLLDSLFFEVYTKINYIR